MLKSQRFLKLPNKLNYRQLYMLEHEAGYKVVSETNDLIHLSRPADFKRKKIAYLGLSEMRKTELTRKLNDILDRYVDPYMFKDEITTRIRNMSKTMTSLESDFTWEWVGRNLY